MPPMLSDPVADTARSRIEDALHRWAASDPDRLAVVDRERECSYGELLQRARAMASALETHGVAHGDRVALFLDKTLDVVAAFYGAWIAGAVVVPINESLKARQVDHILSDSDSRVLVTSARKLRGLGQADLGSVTTIRVEEIDPVGTALSAPAPPRDRTPAAILYTSGSTGRPKGILISHANLVAGARIVSRYLGLQPTDRLISIPPFSFDYGLNQLLTSVREGATLILQRSHFPPDICRTLRDRGVTVMAAVPPLWIQLAQPTSPFMTQDFPDLRLMTNTGGVFPTEQVKRYREHLPHCDVVLMYGLSEAFRSTYLPPSELDRRPGSMGRAIPETEIFVLDDDGHPCAPGQVGELVHRGPTVALGYWKRPEETARTFRPNPLDPDDPQRVVYSGDLVRRDEDGFLYFVARRDAMIKSYGNRISPEEVEEICLDSGLVAEVAVHGRPDPVAGAVIVAHVVPAPGADATEEALLAHCRRAMPSYMVPSEFRLHDNLPRTASGKIDRKQLAEEVLS